jgi:hypothetical protein
MHPPSAAPISAKRPKHDAASSSGPFPKFGPDAGCRKRTTRFLFSVAKSGFCRHFRNRVLISTESVGFNAPWHCTSALPPRGSLALGRRTGGRQERPSYRTTAPVGRRSGAITKRIAPYLAGCGGGWAPRRRTRWRNGACGCWRQRVLTRFSSSQVCRTSFPLKHVPASAAAWPYSSFHRAVAQGQYPNGWAGADMSESLEGEREC